MIDRNSVHPVILYKRIVDNLDGHDEPKPKFRIEYDRTAGPGVAKWMDDAFKEDLAKADNLDDHDCKDCHGTGYVGIDTGGGNTRTTFCKCPKGQELAEADEKAREAKEYDDMEGER